MDKKSVLMHLPLRAIFAFLFLFCLCALCFLSIFFCCWLFIELILFCFICINWRLIHLLKHIYLMPTYFKLYFPWVNLFPYFSWFIYFAIDHLPISAHTCAIGLVQSYCFIFCASILIWTIARYGHGLRQRHLAWDLIIGKDNLIDANSMRPRIASKIEWIHYLVLG